MKKWLLKSSAISVKFLKSESACSLFFCGKIKWRLAKEAESYHIFWILCWQRI